MSRLGAATVTVALAVAACSGGGGVDATVDAPSQTTERFDAEAGLGYRWKVGDCLRSVPQADLPYEPFGEAALAPCGGEHGYEVVDVGRFDYGPDEPFSLDAIGDEIRESCAVAVHDYVGVWLVESAFEIILYLPDADEWAAGHRYETCLVYDPRAGGDAPTWSGSARDSGALYPADAGQCIAEPALRGRVVECSARHFVEVIGTFTHPGGSDEPYPGIAGARGAATAGCNAVLQTMMVPGAGSTGRPSAFADVLSRPEWLAGLRTVVCGALVLDAGGPLPLIGSLGDRTWRVLEGEHVA